MEISEQSTLLCEQKNCYPVVRFSRTPYRLVPSQKALINHTKFGKDRSREYKVTEGRISACSIGMACRL